MAKQIKRNDFYVYFISVRNASPMHVKNEEIKKKSMNCIHSFSIFWPWALFRIIETIFTAK